MNKLLDYQSFLESKGMPISTFNPGSKEFALTVEDSFQAIKLLEDSNVAIIGGDVISDDSGKLRYAYQLWGSEYHYLNWACEPVDDESREEYVLRSFSVASEGICAANDHAKKLKKNCFIVLVTEA